MLVLFEKLIGFLCTLFGLSLGAIIVLICLDVGLRDLGLGSLPWLIELTEYLMYAGTFLAAPWVLRQGSHVRVDILLVAVPKRLAVRLEQAVDLCGLLISLVLLYYGSAVVADAWRSGMVQYKTWYVPEWLLLLAIPVSAALLAAEFVLRVLRVRGVVRDDYAIADRPSI
ncbi:TRAP transporter small permease [Reyranella sp. CPCC 100927]|uniref:TRAP transporter small permease n=1 Tax=Reyranella sp. CPCC 100927 TaxID=2599616 RepID=UPI0011B8148D|nr:TRAP transporter small permease [Reyranella sp. CPCC 100927]TWT08664.1 TRAP transporter small permease [Reyranella sp. CPCC 100927]